MIDDPASHLAETRSRLREEAELARGMDEATYEADLQERIKAQLSPEVADEMFQAVPTAYQWSGLDRYWRKKAERERLAQFYARCSRMRSTASSIRSSGVVREMRKKPSPLGPYIEPGETTTAASSRTVSAKEVEVWPLGTGAQT